MKTRRAISTIVGSVFFLVLLTSGLSVSYMVIETQSDMIDAQQTIADSEIKKIQESFYTSASTGAGNRLAVYVENGGSNPLEIDTLWIINKTSPNQPATKYEVPYTDSVLASGYGQDVLKNKPLSMTPGTYGIKVVSSLGTIKAVSQDLNVGGVNSLRAKLIMNPPNVEAGENATAILYVTNVGNTKMLDVTSTLITVNPPSAVLESSPTIQIKTDLLPAESTVIMWKYKLTGNIGTSITFSTSAQGIDEPTGAILQSNTETSSIKIGQDGSGSGDTQVLTDELFARPEIFMVFPGQFGEDNERGLWGVNVVNPTAQPIDVTRLTVAAQTPRATSSDKVFVKGCEPEDLETVPPATNKWSCPDDNILMWQDTDTPQKIGPKSVFPFLVKIKPGDIGGNIPEPSVIIVQANVFSTLGQFGKAGYGTSMGSDGNGAIPNVYLSKVAGSTTAVNILGNVTGIKAGTNHTFNAVFADFDTDTADKIKAGSRLIVNIPKGWNQTAIVTATGFTTSIQGYPDGSSQIIGILQGDITGAVGSAKTITFTSEAPPITTTKMYVMHILADGLVGVPPPDGPYALSPLAETVLQVVP